MTKSWTTTGLAALAIAVLVGCTLLVTGQERVDVTDAPPLRLTTTSRYAVLVVGDSFTGGSEMNDGPVWPQIVAEARDWIVSKDAMSGTGYIAGSVDKPTITDRAADTIQQYSPDLVILAGGYNDADSYPAALIAAAARTTIAEYQAGYPDADVIVLSTWASGEPNPAQLALAAGLRDQAAAAGVDYVDVTGYLEAEAARWIGSDGVHPTNDGHRRIAKRMDGALDRLGYPTGVVTTTTLEPTS